MVDVKQLALDAGDVCVFDGRRCSFKQRSGRDIQLNDRCSIECRAVHLSTPFIALLHELLQERLGCNIAVELGAPPQFIYFFKQPPAAAQLAQLRCLEVKYKELANKHQLMYGETLRSINEAINPHGAEVVAWMLSALCARDFSYDITEDGLRWTSALPTV